MQRKLIGIRAQPSLRAWRDWYVVDFTDEAGERTSEVFDTMADAEAFVALFDKNPPPPLERPGGKG